MRILLVRHAQTIENAEHRYQGHIHGRLSPLGLRQTKALAKALAHEKIDYFYGSPLERARLTLEAVRAHHPHLTAVFADELMERGKGVWEGWKINDALMEDPQLQDKMRKPTFRPKGGESLLDIRKRLRRFLKTIRGHGDEETVFIAGHGILNAEMLRILLKSDAHFSQSNTCINELWWEKSGVYAVRLNDTAHLDALGKIAGTRFKRF